MLKNYFISIRPFIDTPLTILGISNHPCLGFNTRLSKLNTITRPTFCWTLQILLFISNPNPLETFHPQSHNWILKLWLLVFIEKKN
jgi:hypothetical protein